MKALIPIAGKGTRINEGETRIIPKPLHKIGNKTILERVILSMKEAGIEEFILVTGFMSEHIKEYLKDGSDLGVSITYVYNPEFEKGQGLSILKGKDLLYSEPIFLLSCGDHIFEPKTLKKFIARAKDRKCRVITDSKLGDYVHARPTKILVGENEKILHLGKDLTEFNRIECGCHLMTPEFFECLEEGKYLIGDDVSSNDGCRILVERGHYFIHDMEKNARWGGINTKEDLIEMKKKFPEWLIEE